MGTGTRRVIVVGLDGLEPSIVEPMLKRGELPALDRLRAQGGFARVATTTPAQTPVAWSSFATGTNPGGHGIFDFLRRDPRTYLPDLALNRYEQPSIFLPPKAVNLRRGVPFWQVLGEAGVPSVVLRCPCTYPPDVVPGRSLSGMGVPDLRGGLGTTTFYTTVADESPRESEQVVTPRRTEDGTFTTHVIGPRHPRTREDVQVEIHIQPEPSERRVIIRSDGTPGELVVEQGRWSDWLCLKFKLGFLQGVRGLVRFHLVRLEPELELHASPLNFDPDLPMFPISAPDLYASDLAASIGPYYTTGMVEDHTGLMNERIDESAFLDQCEDAWREREAMLRHELDRFDAGFLYCLFDTPDRVQHLFWRFREPEHPANRKRSTPPEFSQVIEDHYRKADAMVALALEAADEETLVIALSDHGFNSFQRGVHLNSWLFENDLLALQEGITPGAEAGDLLQQVDWSRTRAYAIGLSGIYLNLQGREEQGIVAPEDAEGLKAQIAEGLRGLVDPDRGTVAIRDVQSREALYNGPYAEESPDLMVQFAPGYRISWGSSMGGVPEGRFEDNTKKWAGDHIIDPALVPGVLLLNRPFSQANPRLIDLAPTILDALGVPKTEAMEGESLLP